MNLRTQAVLREHSISQIRTATPLAHGSRKAAPAPPSDQTTRYPEPVSVAPGREGWREVRQGICPHHTEALATVRVCLHSTSTLPCAPETPAEDTRRELLIASSRWVGSEGRGEATGASTTMSGFLAIQFGIHVSFSCMLKSTRQSHKW